MAMFISTLTGQSISDRRITCRSEGMKLERLLEEITREYGIRFYYKSGWIDTVTITRDYQETPLIQVLNGLFQNKKSHGFFFRMMQW